MQSDRRPIGVFDSGLGGLTVLRAVRERMPDESLIYFGDTARVPYGSKSAETVTRFSREIVEFLLGHEVKAVVAACNSASALAVPLLKAEYTVPIMGVIGPGARLAVERTRSGRIGVIGTRATIASGAYERAMAVLDPAATVVTQPCPLFVSLVEEGWTDRPAARLIAEEYLAPLRGRVDTLVLGCTHYPLLKPLIAELMGPDVVLIDSAESCAAELGVLLNAHGLRAPERTAATERFYVSDAPELFSRLSTRFLGRDVGDVRHVPEVAELKG
ncbi:MAG: glutamate racemase [Verrucomicrobia bacterium]|nr:glutamate racemase [Verrucomicrobiota bacterium]